MNDPSKPALKSHLHSFPAPPLLARSLPLPRERGPLLLRSAAGALMKMNHAAAFAAIAPGSWPCCPGHVPLPRLRQPPIRWSPR